MTPRIYLDHAATTPLRTEARAAMEAALSYSGFGNPSSLHAQGQQARHALDSARDTIAQSIGAEASEITFTSGGTEADNFAILGILLANQTQKPHLITSQSEHEAVLNTARFAESLGFTVTYLPVDSDGIVNPDDVARAMTPRTRLVSIMHANNEVGTIQPVHHIAEIAHAGGALFHTDAVQTYGQLQWTVGDLGADLISLSSHKIYGPLGTGALYVRSGISIEPWLHGGAQERGRRAGTENVAAIVGFAAAAQEMLRERKELSERLARQRDRFIIALQTAVPGVVLNGHPVERLPNNVNISVPGCDSETLLLALDRKGVSASSGSACTSGSIEPSHVLVAMGLPQERVGSALRFTLGRGTTDEELVTTAEILGQIVRRSAA